MNLLGFSAVNFHQIYKKRMRLRIRINNRNHSNKVRYKLITLTSNVEDKDTYNRNIARENYFYYT